MLFCQRMFPLVCTRWALLTTLGPSAAVPYAGTSVVQQYHVVLLLFEWFMESFFVASHRFCDHWLDQYKRGRCGVVKIERILSEYSRHNSCSLLIPFTLFCCSSHG